PRCDSQDALEDAREPAWITGGRLASRDSAARFAHQGDGWIGAIRIGRMAAAAGAEAFALCRFGDREERDLRAARPAAGAGRTAIDPGRAHRVHECAIEPAIPCHHGFPTLSGTHGGECYARAHASSIRFVRSNP